MNCLWIVLLLLCGSSRNNGRNYSYNCNNDRQNINYRDNDCYGNDRRDDDCYEYSRRDRENECWENENRYPNISKSETCGCEENK